MSTLLEPTSSSATPRTRPRPSTDTDDRTRRQSGEIRKLTTLLEVSQALASPPNIKSAFHRVLEILERFHGTSRSVIALPRDEARRLYLQASIGIRTPHADTPLAPNLAQQVYESGRPVVVPRVSQEPAWRRWRHAPMARRAAAARGATSTTTTSRISACRCSSRGNAGACSKSSSPTAAIATTTAR